MKKMIIISAIWCPSCIIMRDRFESIIKEIKDVEVVSLDFDDDEEEVKEYNIGNTLPVCILADGEKEVRSIGEKSLKELKKIFID